MRLGTRTRAAPSISLASPRPRQPQGRAPQETSLLPGVRPAAASRPEQSSNDHPCMRRYAARLHLVSGLTWRRAYTALLTTLSGAARMAGMEATRLEKVRSGREQCGVRTAPGQAG